MEEAPPQPSSLLAGLVLVGLLGVVVGQSVANRASSRSSCASLRLLHRGDRAWLLLLLFRFCVCWPHSQIPNKVDDQM